MTTSSKENESVSSTATTIAGGSSGNVTRWNTRRGDAPRSAAASSSEIGSVASRAWITTVAYAELNTTCPITIAVTPSSKCSRRTRMKSAGRQHHLGQDDAHVGGRVQRPPRPHAGVARPEAGRHRDRHRDQAGRDRDLGAGDEVGADALVAQGLGVPLGGEAAPAHQELVGVDRVDHHDHDRQVQEARTPAP